MKKRTSNLIHATILFFLLFMSFFFFLEIREGEERGNFEELQAAFSREYFHSEMVGATRTLGLLNIPIREALLKKEADLPKALEHVTKIKYEFSAAIVYVMDIKGNVLISSLYEGDKKLTGNNYAFREYFTEAMKGNNVVYPALGITTKKRGLYYASPVRHENKTIGVVVIKMGLEPIENVLHKVSNALTFLATPEGVVFASNRDEWLYKKAIKGNRQLIGKDLERQFGVQSLDELTNIEIDFNAEHLFYQGIFYHTYKRHLYLYEQDNPWMLIYAAPIFPLWLLMMILGGVASVYVIGVFAYRSFLGQQRAEQLIKGQEMLIENVFQSLSYPFYVIDLQKKDVVVSNTVAGLWRWPLEERVKKMTKGQSGDLVPIEEISNSARNYVKEFSKEIFGKQKVIEVHSHPIYDGEGKVVQIIEYALDVTERKENELEKERMMKQIYQTSKLASVGELAAGVAHEINNPMAIIKGFLDILSKGILKMVDGDESKVPSSIRESLEKIRYSIDRITNIVTGLRTYSRSDSASEFTVVDAKEIVERSIALVAPVYQKLNIHFVSDFAEMPMPVKIIEGKLQQVIMNFFSNARDAIQEAKREEGVIKIVLATPFNNGKLRMTIEDNGIGIKTENMEKIFETFYTTKPPGKGTGLGMSISYSIIQSFHGDVKIESVHQVGTKIIVELPLSEGFTANTNS